MIRWNVRTPDEVTGDIRSQVAANHVCSQKIIAMMTDEGLNTLDDLADEIISRTERSMRSAIARIPTAPTLRGCDRGRRQTQGRGHPPDVDVKGSDLRVDFSGTSPQVDWGGNVVYNFTYAYVFMAIKSAFDPTFPSTRGHPAGEDDRPRGLCRQLRFPAAVAHACRSATS